MKYYSTIRNTTICDNMHRYWEYHFKQNKSDGKGQEPYVCTHIWDIKQKAIKEQIKQRNKFIDTDNSIVVTREEGVRGEDKEGKRGQIYGDWASLNFGEYMM